MRIVWALAGLLGLYTAAAQTVVSSFSELLPYLDDNDVDVVMTPGTYRITPDDCGDAGSLFPDVPLFSFTGTNTLFDFTDVIFEFETEVFQAFGSVDVKEVAVFGANQVLKNLTMIDIGNTRPSKTAQGVLLDGVGNTVEGFNLTVRGSYPYGYGDIFGKGSGYVIKHYKHSAILVRGSGNHLLNCKVFHRSYGHGIFCQGSIDAVIEGCYVEGEVRTSDDVLAEEGYGSAADGVDFVTNWGEDENGENGYVLQPGWMFSCQEDGIRAYNTGLSLDGVNSTNTRNISVIDCTVVEMRSGVPVGFCDDTKYIENVVLKGTENGIWPGSGGEVVDCAGYASYGPLLQYNYDSDKNSTVDLTFLGAPNRYGNELIAYIGGSGHDVTLRGRDDAFDPDLHVKVGGVRTGIRFYIPDKYSTLSASGVDLNNLNQHTVEMGTNSASTAGQTGGGIIDLGTGNSLSSVSFSSAGGFGVLQTIEAEDFSAQSGTAVKTAGDGIRYVGAEAAGDWIRFDDFFFGSGPNRFEARVKSGTTAGEIELRRDTVDGELLGTCTVSSNINAWTAETITLEEPRTKCDLYLVFKGSGPMPELDSFRFYVTFTGHEIARGLVGHWKFDEASGTAAADSSGYGNHGTVTNAVWTDGKKSGALDFSAAGSSVTLPASAFDSIQTEVTIAFWAYGSDDQPMNNSAFYAADADDNRVLNIHLPYGNSSVYFDASEGPGYEDRINKAAADAEIKGAWAHWVFTKNSKTGNQRIYRNGALWHAGAAMTEELSGITAGSIGSQLGSLSYSGRIDDVRLYDIELMEHEAAALFDAYSSTDSGAPHSWFDTYGLAADGDYDAAALLDSDGDGLPNGGEYAAGTDPTNSASVLRMVDAEVLGGSLQLGWSSVTGKTYDVWFKTNLTESAWTLAEVGISGTASNSVSAVEIDSPAGFFQVEVE